MSSKNAFWGKKKKERKEGKKKETERLNFKTDI